MALPRQSDTASLRSAALQAPKSPDRQRSQSLAAAVKKNYGQASSSVSSSWSTAASSLPQSSASSAAPSPSPKSLGSSLVSPLSRPSSTRSQSESGSARSPAASGSSQKSRMLGRTAEQILAPLMASPERPASSSAASSANAHRQEPSPLPSSTADRDSATRDLAAMSILAGGDLCFGGAPKVRGAAARKSRVSIVYALLPYFPAGQQLILKLLRVVDIVALNLASPACHALCRSPHTRKLIVPTYIYRRQWIKHIECSGVVSFCADNARIISVEDHQLFESVAGACCNMQTLFCGYNDSIDPVVLTRLLVSKPDLRTVDIAFNDLARGHAKLELLFRALPPKLMVLDLSYNLLMDEHAYQLAEALDAQGAGLLRELSLRSNYFANGAGFAFGVLLSRPAGKALRRLDLRTNRLQPDGACKIFSSLMNHVSMRELRLGFNTSSRQVDLTVSGHAAAALRSPLTNILHLDLNYAQIRDAGAQQVAASLFENRTLRRLDLTHNFIGESGAETLSDCLEENQSLQILDLRDNLVLDRGAAWFARVLPKNYTLKVLMLGRNEIGDEGGWALATAVDINKDIRVDVTGNDMNHELERRIARCYIKLKKDWLAEC